MSLLQQILDTANLTTSLVLEANAERDTHVDEINGLIDLVEQRDTRIAELEASMEYKEQLLVKQNHIIQKAMEVKNTQTAQLTVANAKVKELEQLDTKRLEKVNKAQKKTITDLKESLTKVEKSRKEAVAKNKELHTASLNNGVSMLHVDANHNGIRVVPGLFVAENNDFDGLVNSPVLEFINSVRGITRQGYLNSSGDMVWSSAKNSSPTADMTLVAKHKLLDYCKTHNIKLA